MCVGVVRRGQRVKWNLGKTKRHAVPQTQCSNSLEDCRTEREFDGYSTFLVLYTLYTGWVKVGETVDLRFSSFLFDDRRPVHAVAILVWCVLHN
ncbi:hypothetical protein LCGC14_3155840, partial [marine sediment metagenome]